MGAYAAVDEAAAVAAAMIWFLGKSRFSQEKVIIVVPAGRSATAAQSGCCKSEDATAAEEAVLQGEIDVGVPDSFNTGRGVTTAMWPPITECIWNK